MNNNVIKKEKRNISGIIGIIAITIVLALVLIFVSNNKGQNRIKEVNFSTYEDKIKSDEYTIVLLASPTCSHCVAYKPFMNKAAIDYDFNVYYVNVASENLTIDNYTSIHDSISILKDLYSEDGTPSIPTPTTVIFKKGVEIASKSGNIGYDGFVNFLKENKVV